MSKVYDAVVSRAEPPWLYAEIPELGGATQAHDLAEAEDMARDWIALYLDVDVEVRVKVEDRTA